MQWEGWQSQRSGGLDKHMNTSINIISHEKVVGVWDFPSNLEELHEVMELAVDVSTDNNGSSY